MKEKHERKKGEGDSKGIKFFFEHEYFKSSIVRWLILITLISNLGNWGLIFFGIAPSQNPIILHYNVYFGVDLMGDWKQAFVLPAIGLIVFFVNFMLGFYFYEKKERIASYILLIAALMIQFSLLIGSLSIVLINY